jgi:hypothetical protein
MSSSRSVQQILASASAIAATAKAETAVAAPVPVAAKPAAKPAATLVPRPTLHHKQCRCGRKFVTANAKHDTCSRCMRAHFARQRRLGEATAQANELRECLRDAFVKGNLPHTAKVTQRNSQVVVVWKGRSHTFYVPPSLKTERAPLSSDAA